MSHLLSIENAIKSIISTLGPSDILREACEYALLSGGKRFRPLLVYMTADALGNQTDVTEAALAVEFFHTASLIADDLPCMDNDDERRKKPTLHKVYGESTALLASYALIAAGYEAIARCALKSPFKDSLLCSLAIQNISHNTGLLGATGGQFLDLNPVYITQQSIEEIIHKKTVSLFEISFVLGWLFGGGSSGKLDLVKKAAMHFGMAFQIADDLQDIDQDNKNNCKINIASYLGIEKASEKLFTEIAEFFNILNVLDVDTKEFHMLSESLIPLNKSAC